MLEISKLFKLSFSLDNEDKKDDNDNGKVRGIPHVVSIETLKDSKLILFDKLLKNIHDFLFLIHTKKFR